MSDKNEEKEDDEELEENEEGEEEQDNEEEQDEDGLAKKGKGVLGSLAKKAKAGKGKTAKGKPAQTDSFPKSKKELLEKTGFQIAGVNITGAKIAVIATALSTAVGGLYGGFEVYKDYIDMKKKIQTYVAPDLSGIDKKIEVLSQKLSGLEKSEAESNDYIRDIRKDLKGDVQTATATVDRIEKTNKDTERELRSVSYGLEKDLNSRMKDLEKDVNDKIKDNSQKMVDLEKRIDEKLQKAFDNPLAGK